MLKIQAKMIAWISIDRKPNGTMMSLPINLQRRIIIFEEYQVPDEAEREGRHEISEHGEPETTEHGDPPLMGHHLLERSKAEHNAVTCKMQVT